jgi:hypothetical protein
MDISMGIDLPCTISATRGDHSRQHVHMSIHPMDIDSPWPISATQGDHSWQLVNMYTNPKDIDSLCTILVIQVTVLGSIGA